MFNMFKKASIANRVEETILYEFVLDEIESGIQIRGLWAKAMANSDGDMNKANSIYMKYRVQDIKDIFTTIKIAYEELSKNEIANYLKNLDDIEQILPEEKIKKLEELKQKKLEDTLYKNNVLFAGMTTKDKCVANYKSQPGSVYFVWKNNTWIRTNG
ncbi:MAG: hypothetical protein U9N59_03675 [Campylobacterota bacterium]|nr:hypothetical protein [Campylobacterota bacterium]